MDITNNDTGFQEYSEFLLQLQCIEDDFMLRRISLTEAVNRLVNTLSLPIDVVEETVIDWIGG